APVRSVAYSRDGRWFASASIDGTVSLWDAGIGLRVRTFPVTGYPNVAFSPDSRWLACASDGALRLWSVTTGQALLTFRTNIPFLNSLTYSPDGRWLVIGPVVIDAVTGERKRTLSGFRTAVASVAYSPDRRSLALATQDKALRIWDADSGRVLQTLTGHTG